MNRSTFIILLIVAFSAMLGLGIISPFLPEFAKAHGVNGLWLGLIFSGFAISRTMIMPIVGKVSDKYGRKMFVAAGLALFAVISLFYPLAGNPIELVIVRLVHGLAAGLIMPIVSAYIGESAKKGSEGATMGTISMIFYLGLATGPFLGGFINKHFGFDWIFYTMSILGTLSFLIVILFLPASKKKAPEPEEEKEHMSFFYLLHFNYIKAILIIAAVMTMMVSAFLSFLPSLAKHLNIGTYHIGIIMSCGILVAGLLQVPFGKFSDKLDRKGKLIQVGTGTSVGMIALVFLPFCPDFHMLLISGLFIGLGAAISTPALQNISVEIGKKAGMGLWMGTIQSFMSLGIVLTPLIAGVIMDFMGIHYVFYIIFCLVFFGILWFLRLLQKRFIFRKKT